MNVSPRRIKVVVVGDGGGGKTALLIRYTTGAFPPADIPATFDCEGLNVQVPDVGNIQLELFNKLGNESYERLRPLMYPGTDVTLICFSVANPATLENVQEKVHLIVTVITPLVCQWIREVRHHLPQVPVVLVGCQGDLRSGPNIIQQLESRGYQGSCSYDEAIFALKIGAACYVECSSLLGDGVTEVFETAIRAAVRGLTKKPRYQRGARCLIC
ncbi:GTP-binding protein of the rho subfamily of ras-like protein [Flagelloscypha sp. PMI_526]|nr:GTP-binding protein of the rho subfamily of ras-like protein [Flagelloscypha sp. PMI_526]